MRILLHMEQFVNNRRLRYQPYCPWLGLWFQKANEVPAEEVDSFKTPLACQICASLGVQKCGSCELAFYETCH